MGLQGRRGPLIRNGVPARAHALEVIDEPVTTAELLEKWREATRAAELAKRLAEAALETAERADKSAVASEDIAKMAERAAEAAGDAAAIARRAADEATTFAADIRGTRLRNANEVVDATAAKEDVAKDAYHDAEKEARERLRDGEPPA
jgi:hypothetical protein